jgi:hypothetical protein
VFESIAVIAHHDSSSSRAQFRDFDFSLSAEISFKQIDHVLHEMSNRRRLVSATRSFALRINQACVLEILTRFSFNNRVEIHIDSSCNRRSVVALSISLQLFVREFARVVLTVTIFLL